MPIVPVPIPTSEAIKPLLPNRTLSVGLFMDGSIAKGAGAVGAAIPPLINAPAPTIPAAPIVAPMKSRRLNLSIFLPLLQTWIAEQLPVPFAETAYHYVVRLGRNPIRSEPSNLPTSITASL